MVEQQILDIISGQTPAENVTLSPSTLALLAASKPQPPPETEAQRKERLKAEKEKEKREQDEREQKEKEKKERERREREEKRRKEKEERRSRRLSMDPYSPSKLWRRTSNINPEEAKELAKFSESYASQFDHLIVFILRRVCPLADLGLL